MRGVRSRCDAMAYICVAMAFHSYVNESTAYMQRIHRVYRLNAMYHGFILFWSSSNNMGQILNTFVKEYNFFLTQACIAMARYFLPASSQCIAHHLRGWRHFITTGACTTFLPVLSLVTVLFVHLTKIKYTLNPRVPIAH